MGLKAGELVSRGARNYHSCAKTAALPGAASVGNIYQPGGRGSKAVFPGRQRQNFPFPLATAAFTALVRPDKWRLFSRDREFRRGRQALCIANQNFLPLLNEPFANAKAVIFRQPVSNKRLLRKIPQCAATQALVAAAR